MNIAFIGNQGGRSVLEFYAGIARTLTAEFDVAVRFAVWLDAERRLPAEFGLTNTDCTSFESYVRDAPPVDEADVDRLMRDYREVHWSEVVAVERAFSDYSMLLGGAGDRRETIDYVQRLVASIVRYLENNISGCDAIVCQTADTLFSLVAVKVARHHGVRYFAIRPGTLLEPGKGGGFFANTEYLECDRMLAAYERRAGQILTLDERRRTDTLLEAIQSFGGLTKYHAATSKGKSRGRRAITPNLKRLFPYLIENYQRNKSVEYIKIDPARKLLANLLRISRKWMSRNCFGSQNLNSIPARSVLYALHYQPEQSTLAQGVWYANQVALVENVSKSLPLGYTLVVKEHPWGRGNRPRWQYDHMAGLYNVEFCDAPAKQIIERVDAVVTVTGTVAVESLAFDKPCVLLGRSYFEFCDLFYRVRDVQDLPDTLARILIDGDYQKQPDRQGRLHRFLMAYLDGLIPHFPLPEHAADWGRALAEEMRLDSLPIEGGSG
jgi:hypothetical protein